MLVLLDLKVVKAFKDLEVSQENLVPQGNQDLWDHLEKTEHQEKKAHQVKLVHQDLLVFQVLVVLLVCLEALVYLDLKVHLEFLEKLVSKVKVDAKVNKGALDRGDSQELLDKLGKEVNLVHQGHLALLDLRENVVFLELEDYLVQMGLLE